MKLGKASSSLGNTSGGLFRAASRLLNLFNPFGASQGNVSVTVSREKPNLLRDKKNKRLNEKKILPQQPKVIDSSPPSAILIPSDKILGNIYLLLVKINEERKLKDEVSRNLSEEQNLEEEKRNEQIVESLKEAFLKRPKPVVKVKTKTIPKASSIPSVPSTPPVSTTPALPAPTPAPSIPKPSVTTPPASVAMGAARTGLATGGALGELIMSKESNLKGKGSPDAYNYQRRPGGSYIPVIRDAGTGKGDDVLGGRRISEMTVAEIQKLQAEGKLFAVGKWQIIPKTMDQMVRDTKIDPKTQIFDDKFQSSLFEKFFIKYKRPLLERYLQGDPKISAEDAAMQIAMEWSSVGVPRNVKAHEFGKNAPRQDRKKGESFYGETKPGQSTPSDKIIQELKRMQKGKSSANIEPSPQTIGQKIDNLSSINMLSTFDLEDSPISYYIDNSIYQYNHAQTPNEEEKERFDDSPPLYRVG